VEAQTDGRKRRQVEAQASLYKWLSWYQHTTGCPQLFWYYNSVPICNRTRQHLPHFTDTDWYQCTKGPKISVDQTITTVSSQISTEDS
jgi:hypothetical protein